MSDDRFAPLLRTLRRRPLLAPDGEDARGPVLTRKDIEGLVPHRGSMLLLDAIDLVDTRASALRARRTIDPADPVLVGHFPGSPVYPGVLLVEMMGQAGLCLAPLLASAADAADAVTSAPSARLRGVPSARLTHIHHAAFLAPVLPGDDVTVLAGLLDESLTLTAVGQVYRGTTLCAYAISEVYLAE
jgi:3-hydroxyacyl-[acyl-carrier-protein] dehydratase